MYNIYHIICFFLFCFVQFANLFQSNRCKLKLEIHQKYIYRDFTFDVN